MGKSRKIDNDVVCRPSDSSFVSGGEPQNESVTVASTDSALARSASQTVCIESSFRVERHAFLSPETLKSYEEIYPGLGLRLLERIEKEQDFQFEKERALIEASKTQADRDFKTTRLGQILVVATIWFLGLLVFGLAWLKVPAINGILIAFGSLIGGLSILYGVQARKTKPKTKSPRPQNDDVDKAA